MGAVRRSVVVLVASTSMLLVGCGSDDPTSTPAAPEAPAESPLEGTWQTGPVSVRDAEATLRRHGLAEWIEDFRRTPPFSRATVLDLSIDDGQWNLYGESRGRREPIDYDADYEIDGDTVVFHHSDGSNTYRWSVDGDKLSLEFVRSTLPRYRGIPDEVFQRALYMTRPFTRAE
jgi:hypothetical protein